MKRRKTRGKGRFPIMKGATTIAEAARRIGIHNNTMRGWIKQGYVKVILFPSRRRLVPESEIERLIEELKPVYVTEKTSSGGFVMQDKHTPQSRKR